MVHEIECRLSGAPVGHSLDLSCVQYTSGISDGERSDFSLWLKKLFSLKTDPFFPVPSLVRTGDLDFLKARSFPGFFVCFFEDAPIFLQLINSCTLPLRD